MKLKAGRPKKYVYASISIADDNRKFFYNELMNGGCEIKGIGLFRLREIRRKKVFNNFSKKVLVIPAHRKVHFLPDAKIKSKLCKTI